MPRQAALVERGIDEPRSQATTNSAFAPRSVNRSNRLHPDTHAHANTWTATVAMCLSTSSVVASAVALSGASAESSESCAPQSWRALDMAAWMDGRAGGRTKRPADWLLLGARSGCVRGCLLVGRSIESIEQASRRTSNFKLLAWRAPKNAKSHRVEAK